MNKWYRSNLAKGILIVSAHILAVLAVVGVLMVAQYPGIIKDVVSGEAAKNYEDSNGFTEQVQFDSWHILNLIEYQKKFGESGELNKEQAVDIEQYSATGELSDKNSSGLSYRLGDLYNIAESIQNSGLSVSYGSDVSNSVIVCKKEDGTYDYFLYSEFKQLIEQEELSFVMNQEGEYTAAEILKLLKSGQLYQGSYENSSSGLKDKDGKVRYDSCWSYDGRYVDIEAAPVGYDSILDLVNQDEKWNGRLDEVYGLVYDTAASLGSNIDSYQNSLDAWQEGDTNLSYLYADMEAKHVYSNIGEYKEFGKLEQTLENMKKSGKYAIIRSKLSGCETNLNGVSQQEWKNTVKNSEISDKEYVFAIRIDTSYPIQDEYYTQDINYSESAPSIRDSLIMCIASVILFIGVIIWLTAVAGRRRGDEELHLNTFDRWKTEIAAALMCCVLFVPSYLSIVIGTRSYVVEDGGYYVSTVGGTFSTEAIITLAVAAACLCCTSLIAYLSLVRRIKANTLWKNSILRSLIRLIQIAVSNFNSIWKTALAFGGFIILHWMAAGSGGEGVIIFFVLAAEVLAGLYLMRRAIGVSRIKDGLKRIADGEVNHQISLHGLKGEQLIIAQRINTIGEGLDAAVEASMKNERLKTDLITNVSHDIKTPLTSIINYVDLLKRENFTDPKILGYLDILEAKAQRLKTLTEDVVEASKVSSGNINLEYMNINLVEMIQQTSGEFEEKFAARRLEEVLTLPDEEAIIRVDGRRMWRVLENIYNNAAKYAMEGTRVYADLSVTNLEVIFTLKNMSEQPLNISADELTERFIRGDVSRNTEGSGLGLSIATNLTEMQGGKFELYLDGDLFRVTVTFPRMVKKEQ